MTAEIVIDQLTVENFGPYYGKTTFDFRPVEGRCGILIGGKNGAGKTYLLRALYLAVIGEKGVDDLKKVEPDFDFNESRNRKAKAEGKPNVCLEVQLSRREESGNDREGNSLTLIRQVKWKPNGAPVWKSYAIENGRNEERDETRLQKLRDNFLPRHLARFFFFDAERGQSLNLSEKDIVEGINRILGLWNYTELKNYLDKIPIKIRREYQSNSSSRENRKLSEIIAESGKIEGDIKDLDSEKEDKGLQRERLDSEISEIDEKLKSTGAVDPEEIQKLSDERENIKVEEGKIKQKLEAAWEKALPIALLGKFRKELHTCLLREEIRHQWEQRKKAVESKIPEIEDKVFIKEPSKEFELSKECLAYYLRRLRQALNDLFYPPPPDMPKHVYVCDQSSISDQIRRQLADGTVSVSEIKEAVQRRDILSANLRELESKLKMLTRDPKAIESANKLRKEKCDLDEQRNTIEKRLKEIGSEVDQLNQKLREQERKERNQSKVVEKAKKGRNLIKLATRYLETVEKIRKKAAEEIRTDISEKVGDLWIDIVKRKRAFLGMHFDKNWNCFLFERSTGKPIPWNKVQLSDGQRQVQILAFYEVLRQLAQRVPPMVVDTPLGRLDKEVRQAVLDKIYLQGHQSVILATNAEMDPGDLFDLVKDQLTRVYTLEAQEDQNSPHYKVRVVNNYFGKNL